VYEETSNQVAVASMKKTRPPDECRCLLLQLTADWLLLHGRARPQGSLMTVRAPACHSRSVHDVDRLL
jgi:hypothetical protein